MSASKSIISHSSHSNDFFNSNAIRPLQRSSSTSHHSSTQQLPITTNTQTKGSINPKSFVHREVFNTQLYQTVKPGATPNEMKKFFKISISSRDRQTARLGDEEGRYLKQANSILAKANYHDRQQLHRPWSSLNHHVIILSNLLREVDEKDPVKCSISHVMEYLEQFVIKVSAQLSKLDRSIKEHQINITGIKRKRAASLVVNQQKQEDSMKNEETQFISHLAKTHATFIQPNGKNTDNLMLLVNKTKNKLNAVQFQNKKLTLNCERLSGIIEEMKKGMQKKNEEIQEMRREKAGMAKQREGYEYKIRKLKQELEVAHIVKQQNLADKMNFILGWKL